MRPAGNLPQPHAVIETVQSLDVELGGKDLVADDCDAYVPGARHHRLKDYRRQPEVIEHRQVLFPEQARRTPSQSPLIEGLVNYCPVVPVPEVDQRLRYTRDQGFGNKETLVRWRFSIGTV